MRTELRKTSFDLFLNDFAEAVELATAGEIQEGRSVLAASQRQAEDLAAREDFDQGALLYRYEIACRVFDERYGRKQ